MGRASTKKNKTIYQLVREELGLTREQAADMLKTVTADRIEKIENGRAEPQPYDVMTMAKGYKNPSLCNYYCSNQCDIGKEYVQEIRPRVLSAIVLEMLASLNAASRQKDRIIEIAADGNVSGEEIKDFIFIQEELERISATAEALRLWVEKMLADGVIDPETYRKEKEEYEKNKKAN